MRALSLQMPATSGETGPVVPTDDAAERWWGGLVAELPKREPERVYRDVVVQMAGVGRGERCGSVESVGSVEVVDGVEMSGESMAKLMDVLWCVGWLLTEFRRQDSRASLAMENRKFPVNQGTDRF